MSKVKYLGVLSNKWTLDGRTAVIIMSEEMARNESDEEDLEDQLRLDAIMAELHDTEVSLRTVSLYLTRDLPCYVYRPSLAK